MKEFNVKTHTEDGDRLVGFLTAKMAAVKGFDKYMTECFTKSKETESIFDEYSGLIADGHEFLYYRPTQTVLQAWLRDKHGIHVECNFNKVTKKYLCKLETTWDNPSTERDSYEDSLEIGLLTGLVIIK